MERHQLRVFVVIFSTFVTQISIVRGESMVPSNGNSFVECPSSLYQVKFSSNCTDKCPPNAPYTVLDLCLDFCPLGLSVTCNSIVANTSSAPTKTGNIPVLRCPDAICPKERPFCFDYKCLSDCPQEMIKEDFACVYQCFNRTSMVYNRSCVNECPQESPYNESGICVSKCSTYNARHGNICVRDCPANMFRYNKTCITSCPEQATFEFEILNTKLCFESCPDFTFVEQRKCKLQCPQGLAFLWNRSCVRMCPKSAPIIYVLNRRVPQIKIPICIENCPGDTFFDGISCVHSCDKHMFVYNSTCVSECPTSSPFVLNQACLSQCPSNLLNESWRCVKECSTGNYIFDASCVKNCPETHKYSFNGKCHSNCSVPNLLHWNRSCVEECPEPSIYLLNNTCLTVCPFSHPFYKRVLLRKSYWIYRFHNYCLKSCGDTITPPAAEYESKCRCLAPLLLLSHNSTCVKSCPLQYNLVYDEECIATCPYNLNSYNNTCLHSCPNTTFLYGSQCLDECPLDKPLIHTRTAHGEYINICVEKCPETTFTKGSHCYDQCPDPLVYYFPNRTCEDRCPTQSRFRHRIGNSFSYRCDSSCENYILNDTLCVDNCPSDVPFILGQSCVSKCPASHMFLEQNKQRCLTSCKPPLVAVNQACFRFCPSRVPFIINNTCVEKCPNQFNLTSDSDHQVCKCQDPYFRENDNCTLSCPGKFIVNGVCEDISGCPNEYRFKENSTRGTVCRKYCLENQFVFEELYCISKCPNSAVGNRCVESCPKTHPFTKGSICYSTCPTLTLGKSCVDYCPIFFVHVMSDKTCVRKCPTSYPYEVNRNCLRTCPGPKIVSMENECIHTHECASSKGLYIYKSKCLTYCPSGTFRPATGNVCESMAPGYKTAMIVLACISLSCFLGAYFLFRRTKVCRPKIRNDNI